MATITLKKDTWTSITVDADKTYACQYRGSGACYVSFGTQPTNTKYKSGFVLGMHDVIRFVANEVVWMYSTTNATIVLQELQ